MATIPTGEVVDILLDVSNSAAWMAHCHIADHHRGVASGLLGDGVGAANLGREGAGSGRDPRITAARAR
jgi:Multicopper oxidase